MATGVLCSKPSINWQSTRSGKNKYKPLINGYIRYFDVFNVIPEDINDLVFLFHSVTFESEMLTIEEEGQFIEWIGDSHKCDFHLLYKATRDGFGSAEFHQKCDGRGANISIVKSKNECIFGGYTSESWHNKNGWISDDFAWLYSLRNKTGIRKKFEIVQERGAMYGYDKYGPKYGIHDLKISNNCNENQDSYANLGDSYEGRSNPFQLNDGIEKFKVIDYEVWVMN